jgi:zinc transporter, ZIP family
MPTALQHVLTYLAIPVVVIIVGGCASAFYSPGPKLRSGIQHFAAGLVFAAVASGLLPEILSSHNLFAVVVGFAAGVVLMIGMKWFTEKSKGPEDEPNPMSLVFAAGLDYVVDGLLIGIGFGLSAKAGGILTFALSIEGLFLAIAVTTALHHHRASRGKLILVNSVFGLLLAVGATLGAAVFNIASGSIHTAMLAFGSAALIYLVTEELLVEAHKPGVTENPLTAGIFFAGFLLLLGIEMSV